MGDSRSLKLWRSLPCTFSAGMRTGDKPLTHGTGHPGDLPRRNITIEINSSRNVSLTSNQKDIGIKRDSGEGCCCNYTNQMSDMPDTPCYPSDEYGQMATTRIYQCLFHRLQGSG